MFALISSRSGSQSAMLLRWVLQDHHGPLVIELSDRDMPIFSFPDDNLSKRQWIFTKLGMCIDIVEIWIGIVMGNFRRCLTELSAHNTIMAGYYSLMFLYSQSLAG